MPRPAAAAQELLSVFASEVSAKNRAARHRKWLIVVCIFALVLLAADAGLVSVAWAARLGSRLAAAGGWQRGSTGATALTVRPATGRLCRVSGSCQPCATCARMRPPLARPLTPSTPIDHGRGAAQQGHLGDQQRHGGGRTARAGVCTDAGRGCGVVQAAGRHPAAVPAPLNGCHVPCNLQVTKGTDSPVATAQVLDAVSLEGGVEGLMIQQQGQLQTTGAVGGCCC